VQVEVLEDLLDGSALGQEVEHRHAAAAALAAQDVDAEDPLEQLRPRNARRFRRGGSARSPETK